MLKIPIGAHKWSVSQQAWNPKAKNSLLVYLHNINYTICYAKVVHDFIALMVPQIPG